MSNVRHDKLHLDGVPAEEKIEQLEKVLKSRTLQYAESLRALLQYIASKVIEGDDHQLKEYTIAVDVFGRGGDFNASTDSVVRVQAKRLREKLKEYYENEGSQDRILIDLPKGHYSLVFSYIHRDADQALAESTKPTAESTLAENTAQTASVSGKDRFWRLTALLTAYAAVVILAIAVVVLSISNRSLRKQNSPDEHASRDFDYAPLWEPFFKSNFPTLLILSNPPVYRFSNAMDPKVLLKNSITLTAQEQSWLDESLRDRYVIRQNGAPRLILAPKDYTGIGEAIGLTRVFDLFRSENKAVTFKQSRTVSAEDLKSNNAVLLGSVWSNVWSGKLPVKEDFTYSLSSTIVNHHPQNGEMAEYRPEFNDQTGDLLKDYALITIRPGVTDESTVMVLSGIKSEGTQAAAEFVTKREYLSVLNERLRQLSASKAPPKYYQVLLKVDVDNGIPTTISILAIHALQVARP